MAGANVRWLHDHEPCIGLANEQEEHQSLNPIVVGRTRQGKGGMISG